MSKHSPGPWELVEGSLSAHCCFGWSILPRNVKPDEYRGIIAEVLNGTEADARLIASAPELLAVVRELLDMWLPDGERERIEALLARIDGDEEVTR